MNESFLRSNHTKPANNNMNQLQPTTQDLKRSKLLLLAGLLLAVLPSQLRAEEKAGVKPVVKKETKVEEGSKETATKLEEPKGPNGASILTPTYPKEEATLYQLLKEGIEGAESNKDLKFLTGRKVTDVTPRTIAVKALEHALDIQLSAHQEEIAKQLLREARAVFLPVFSVGYKFNNARTFRRKRTGFIERRVLDPVANPSPTPLPPFRPPSKISEIIFLGFNKEIIPGKIFASKPKQRAPDNTSTITMKIDQQLPWGQSFSITNTTVRRKRYQSRKFPRSFRLPWTTNFLVEFFFPLPFTKNFGPYAPVDTNIKLAKVTKERSEHDLRAVVNSTLQTVDLTYWELVNRMLSVQSTRKNREAVTRLAAQTQKLMDNKRATVFDQTQIQSELARVRNLEVQAWNDYIQVSDFLVDLLDIDSSIILLPRGYHKPLQERMAFDPEIAHTLGQENRPELKAEKIQQKFQKILYENRVQQTRPDLALSGSVNLKQDNTKVGRGSIGNAYEHIFNEDNRRQSYSLTYNRPLFNRAERSQRDQAKLSIDAQDILVRITSNQVKEEVSGALSDLEAAEKRLVSANMALTASRKAFEDAKKLRAAGRLTEFEMIARSQDYLRADLTLIRSKIILKQAETQLLGAQGLLPGKFPERTSPDNFDGYRLHLLQDAGIREFFAEIDDEKINNAEPKGEAKGASK